MPCHGAGNAGGSEGDPAILVVGDSLSAGYGLELSRGWVALLEHRLADRDYGHRVINASVSGDTTSGGLSRLTKALPKHRPEVVIIELGGNDGLRGIPLRVVEKNLAAMIVASRKSGAAVALLGMRIPENYGRRYANQFHSLYKKLADAHGVALVDFFLDGVALDPGLMQADGIHPNAEAQSALLNNAWPAVETALSAVCTSSADRD